MPDNIIEQFYRAIAEDDENFLKKIHIPRSDVFYVREAIYQDTGVWYSLDHVERAMYLEGHLDKSDVYRPEKKRDWE